MFPQAVGTVDDVIMRVALQTENGVTKVAKEVTARGLKDEEKE